MSLEGVLTVHFLFGPLPSQMDLPLSLILFYFFSPIAFGFELALFASNGCYSHDVMMREVGEAFEAMVQCGAIPHHRPTVPSHTTPNTSTIFSSSHPTVSSSPTPNRIHWLQLLMYDFGLGGPLPKSNRWNNLAMDNTGISGNRQFMDRGSRLLWRTTLPLNHNRPWDLRGALFLFEMLLRNQHQCEQFVVGHRFRQFLRRQHTDLVVVDHFLQECFTMAASLLNSPATIQFSNWPIADGYISSLNIPAPPSAYPKTSTAFSANEMHFFFVRLRNALFHAVIASVRTIQSRMIRHFFTSIGHPQIQLERVEAGHIFYAGRAEFLAEPIRPISNRIKHFGCAYCRDPKEYIVPIPAPPAAVKAKLTAKKNCDGELTPNWPTFPPTNWSLPNGTKSVQWREWQPSTESHTRPGNHHHYETIRREFPQLNWAELERNPFVLVSFGSIAKIEFMPSLLLLQFLRAFSRFPGLLFVWQTNSDPEVIRSLLGHSNRSAPEMPGNVRLHRWVPIKTLLAHPKLRYAILHGGINTVNEALIYAGKPVLGLPLQGDQPSNLQRLVDLGMAELVDIAGVWRGQLGPKMALLEQNYAEYARRASRVSAMVESYRKGLGGGQQNFWLRWTANKRLLLKRSGSRFFGLFYRSSTEHFAMVELGSALALLATICAILSR